MSSFVDMSLEDIIKKNRKKNPRSQKPSNTNSHNQIRNPNKTQTLQITDARNKIISKKRTQITDAREKLAELAKQKDARLKLEKMRLQRAQALGRKGFPNPNKYVRTMPNVDRVFTDVSRQVVSKPLTANKFTARRQIKNNSHRFMEQRSIERRKPTERISNLKPIFRTVENDLEIIDEPMEDDFLPSKSPLMNRKASLQLKIVTHNNDLREKRITSVQRTALREKEQSPPRLPSILKKRPMAALRSDDKVERETEKPHLEYRIIVSNLRNTVTSGDIQELFGDVGGMLESRLVRPGTAEVIYKTQEDAQKAVELYHNRQLDGQPMNCLLVTPRAPSTNTRNSSKPALYSTNSNVEPDISTFHKVLFSNL